ncbi:hypothetical protein PSI22_05530 [Xenorhabdus sp. XENO-7]|uniref:DUF4435 domain-containing protein n=1 Tax=Xenorhabdus aichiensis TaxID=3025874 RepID=A0ABT5M483_9GAMM|nr:hypothetical protein [Xenorhabdus aichiensis]MDC9621101.1 hypothetical protein [Xenorhabdus aichiensis]
MVMMYDVKQYIVKTRMSSKKRILVEGKDDKAHIENLIFEKFEDIKVEIDTAENIKGENKTTASNNRAKIEHIHNTCKSSKHHRNLHFLCDREYLKFNIGKEIEDAMNEHENDGNLNWTIGHSFENYFLDKNIILDAFGYLSGLEFKRSAINLFEKILPSAIKLATIIALSAREIKKSSYPGNIQWSYFSISENSLNFNIDEWKSQNPNELSKIFVNYVEKFTPIIEKTELLICSRICRGHTAVLILQRIFSACLYSVGKDIYEPLSKKSANEFANIKESSISSALSEAWIKTIKPENNNYPLNLINSVA